mmetsp:Transcript_9046/g.18280  ORF Transcript_9046/g.18280 Transcript_9046/m.18280 type:complete len:113 (-) Transcript_9046:587-925(-)
MVLIILPIMRPPAVWAVTDGRGRGVRKERRRGERMVTKGMERETENDRRGGERVVIGWDDHPKGSVRRAGWVPTGHSHLGWKKKKHLVGPTYRNNSCTSDKGRLADDFLASL